MQGNASYQKIVRTKQAKPAHKATNAGKTWKDARRKESRSKPH